MPANEVRASTPRRPGAWMWPLVALIAAAAALAGQGLTRPSLGAGFLYDRPNQPRVLRGFYPNERAPDGLTFAWTHPTAEARFDGLDRAIAWDFRIRFTGTGARSADTPLIVFTVDDVTAAQVESAARREDITIRIPPRNQPGLIVGITAPAMVPGPRDTRRLGLQVDAIELRPAGVALSVGRWPTGAVWQWALWNALLFGVLLAIARIGAAASAAIVVGIAWWQSTLMTSGLAPFTAIYGSRAMTWSAIACGLAALALLAARARTSPSGDVPPQEWPREARCAIVLTAVFVIMKLLVLAHPDTIQGDSMFHVNRLRLVTRGVYYFTSDAPGGQFPYPIALYVIGSWLRSLTSDTMWLLRSIVLVSEALAGLAVFAIAAWAGRSLRAGCLALVLYHIVPAGFQVQAVAYLTNAFGHFSAVLACGALIWLSMDARGGWRWAAWASAVALLSIALLSHVSSFLFLATQCVIWIALRAAMERPWRTLLLSGSAIAAAIVLSTALYYGHFWTLYRDRLVSKPGASAQTGAPAHASSTPDVLPVQRDEAHQTRWAPGWPALRQRLTAVPFYAEKYFSIPLILLSLAGAWLMWRAQPNASTRLIIAWLLAFAVYLALGLFTPLDIRSYLAVSPALAILGALAVERGWLSGTRARWVTAIVFLWCVQHGLSYWLAWFGDRLPR